MNTGIFGEGFPYSNFHDLNMDWIIKIAKDFLDQYSHIQEIISEGEQSLTNLTEQGEESLTNLTTEGLQQLQDKADTLEGLLQEWYNTHSEDIATQLADALTDLNTWYTNHIGFLDYYVTTAIETFTTEAERKGAEVIESIPSDYSHVAQAVDAISENTRNILAGYAYGLAISNNGTSVFSNSAYQLAYAPVENGKYYSAVNDGESFLFGFTSAIPENGTQLLAPAVNYSDRQYIQAPADGYIIMRTLNGKTGILFQEGLQPKNYIPTYSAVDYIARDIMYSSIINKYDYMTRDKDGGAKGATGVQSYSRLQEPDPSTPFFPDTYFKWYPTHDLVDEFRYLNIPLTVLPPTTQPCYFVSFWVKTPPTNANVKVSMYPQVIFDPISPSAIKQNSTIFKNSIQQTIDYHYGNWHHLLYVIPNTISITDILIGSSYCTENQYIYFTNPIITDREPSYYLNYLNKTYNRGFIGKTVNWIGDSLFYGGGSDNYDGWIGRIARKYAISYESMAVSGASICDGTGYYSIEEHVSDFTNKNADYLIFEGGVNDHFHNSPLGTFDPDRYDIPANPTNFTEYFEKLISKLADEYPNSKVGYVIPYKMTSYNQTLDVYDNIGKQYFDRAKEICNKWGIPVLDMREKTPITWIQSNYRRYFTDEVHINKAGYTFTFEIIAEWMKTL